MKTLTAPEVAAIDGATIVDVREPSEIATVSVPGALTIPMGSIVERVGELPEGTIYVLCHSGGRSARVTAYLDEQGYDAVNIDGGILAWEQAGLPVVR